MSNTPRVIVEISGGVCQAVFADSRVEVVVIDHDCEGDHTGLAGPDPASPFNSFAENAWEAAQTATDRNQRAKRSRALSSTR